MVEDVAENRLEAGKSSEDSWGSDDESPRQGGTPWHQGTPRETPRHPHETPPLAASWPDSDDEGEGGEFESFSGTDEEEDDLSLNVSQK